MCRSTKPSYINCLVWPVVASLHCCRVARQVLQKSETHIKPALQKFLSTLILSPVSSNSDLAEQCYAIMYEVCQHAVSIPVLAAVQHEPTIPRLSKCLTASDIGSILWLLCQQMLYLSLPLGSLLVQLYQITPQVLLPVMPHLTMELQVEDESKRLEAVHLLGKLFSLPGSTLVTDYADVLDEFLKRYHDQKVLLGGRRKKGRVAELAVLPAHA